MTNLPEWEKWPECTMRLVWPGTENSQEYITCMTQTRRLNHSLHITTTSDLDQNLHHQTTHPSGINQTTDAIAQGVDRHIMDIFLFCILILFIGVKYSCIIISPWKCTILFTIHALKMAAATQKTTTKQTFVPVQCVEFNLMKTSWGSGQVLWPCTRRNKMLPPSISLPVTGEIAGVNMASLGGCLHSLRTSARWVERFHNKLNSHVFNLERDGLHQVVPCPWISMTWL